MALNSLGSAEYLVPLAAISSSGIVSQIAGAKACTREAKEYVLKWGSVQNCNFSSTDIKENSAKSHSYKCCPGSLWSDGRSLQRDCHRCVCDSYDFNRRKHF